MILTKTKIRPHVWGTLNACQLRFRNRGKDKTVLQSRVFFCLIAAICASTYWAQTVSSKSSRRRQCNNAIRVTFWLSPEVTSATEMVPFLAWSLVILPRKPNTKQCSEFDSNWLYYQCSFLLMTSINETACVAWWLASSNCRLNVASVKIPNFADSTNTVTFCTG